MGSKADRAVEATVVAAAATVEAALEAREEAWSIMLLLALLLSEAVLSLGPRGAPVEPEDSDTAS